MIPQKQVSYGTRFSGFNTSAQDSLSSSFTTLTKQSASIGRAFADLADTVAKWMSVSLSRNIPPKITRYVLLLTDETSLLSWGRVRRFLARWTSRTTRSRLTRQRSQWLSALRQQ